MDLTDALLTFERMPGRYALGLREPAAVFRQLQTVMQLANGRHIDIQAHGQGDSAREAAVRHAACFFIRTALLRPDADHLTVLGLSPGFSPQTLREHYRLMIRLTHPDHQANATAARFWPTDAAQRINAAHDALQRRPDTGAQSTHEKTHQSAGGRPPRTSPPEASSSRWGRARRRHTLPKVQPRSPTRAGHHWRWIVALGGVALTVTALVLNSTGTADHLALRQGPTALPTTETQRPDVPAVADPMALSTDRTTAPVHATPVVVQVASPLQHSHISGIARQPVRPEPTPLHRTAPPDSLSASVQQDMVVTQTAVSIAPTPAANPAASESFPAPATPKPPPDVTSGSRLSMMQVQHILSNVMASIAAGQGSALTQWIDPRWRDPAALQDFEQQFRQVVDDRRIRQLGSMTFDAHHVGKQLVVDGRVELEMVSNSERIETRQMRLRATFLEHEGRPVLTQLMTGPTP